jgi:hypothetical protein
MPKIPTSTVRPDLSWVELIGLLTEAREMITDKPWDDDTRLHERISKALGLPVSYPNYAVEEYEEDA